MKKEENTALVVVHPGSACGSADFNLGLEEGAQARHALARTLHDWKGPVVIVDGELSTDLEHYPQIGIAIDNLLDQANESIRIYACATQDGWAENATRAVMDLGYAGAALTGAWHHPEDRSGCIDAMAEQLSAAGLKVEVLPCALTV